MTMTSGLPAAFRDGHHEMPPVTRNRRSASGLLAAFRDGHHEMPPVTQNRRSASGLPAAFRDGHHEMPPVTRKYLFSLAVALLAGVRAIAPAKIRNVGSFVHRVNNKIVGNAPVGVNILLV